MCTLSQNGYGVTILSSLYICVLFLKLANAHVKRMGFARVVSSCAKLPGPTPFALYIYLADRSTERTPARHWPQSGVPFFARVWEGAARGRQPPPPCNASCCLVFGSFCADPSSAFPGSVCIRASASPSVVVAIARPQIRSLRDICSNGRYHQQLVWPSG